MEGLIKKLRKKLEDDRRTLKWWHGEYYKNAVDAFNLEVSSFTDNKNAMYKMYKYNYFIRQINTPDSIRPDLKDIISEYVG